MVKVRDMVTRVWKQEEKEVVRFERCSEIESKGLADGLWGSGKNRNQGQLDRPWLEQPKDGGACC